MKRSLLIANLLVFVAMFVPGRAQAQIWSSKFDETLDFSLGAHLGGIDVQSGLFLVQDSPTRPRQAVIVDDALTRRADTFGAMLRGNLSISGIRAGVGLGAYRVSGLSASGAAVHARGMGIGGEVFLGYAHGRDIRPYVELRGVWNTLFMDFHRASDGLAIGDETTHDFGLGVRAGLLVALNEYFFVDVGAGHGLLGAENMHFSVALGLPIPLSNL